MAFFELRTPRDMLEKAKREHQRLTGHFDIDNLFNFFVTAYHIKDYIVKTGAVNNDELQKFLSDQDILDSRDLCDKGKHLILTSRKDPDTVIWDSTVAGAPIGVLPLGGGDEWVLSKDGRAVDVELLADRVIKKWEGFFTTHGL